MKWPLSKLYKITPPTRLHLISRDKPDSFSSRRSLLVAAFSYIIKKCIPPHPSCYSPFIVMRFARNLAVLANYRTQPRQIPASNYAPVARRCNRRGLAKPDQGGKQETNGGKLAFIRAFPAFTCHGGGAAVPPFSFISLTFTSQRSLLWYFLGLQESTVPPSSLLSSPLVPHPLANLGCLLPRIAVT